MIFPLQFSLSIHVLLKISGWKLLEFIFVFNQEFIPVMVKIIHSVNNLVTLSYSCLVQDDSLEDALAIS